MLRGPTCPVCDRPGAAPCPPCGLDLPRAGGLPAPPGLDACHALLVYDEGVRDLLSAVKFRNRRDALRWLAEQMAALLRPPAGAVVSWAPTSARRRRQRGYDQAELLARALARRWELPCRRLLRRRPGPPQTGLDASERLRHPGFVARGRPGPVVVLVDDVITTGATLAAAGRTLRGAGAGRVVGVVAARAAPPRP